MKPWLAALACCATLPVWAGSGTAKFLDNYAHAEFFDDFSQADATVLPAQGWVLRSAPGHPGVAGVQFDPAQISVAGGLLQLTLSTDGTPEGTRQPQLCAPRKFLYGTSSARVRFVDEGEASDRTVQAFYQVGALRYDFDPEFSEVDFEYLPHGGWGAPETRLYGVSWQTVRIDPWLTFNTSGQAQGSQAGWHVLTMQVEPTRVRQYIDGRLINEAKGRHVPVTPMALAFSHWLSLQGEVGARREHRFEVDWVLHVQGQTRTPAAMQARVASLRKQGVDQLDSVPDAGLVSECNL